MIEVMWWDEDTIDEHGVQHTIFEDLSWETSDEEVCKRIEQHIWPDVPTSEINGPDGLWSATPTMPDFMQKVRIVAGHWRALQGWTVIRDLGDE